MLNETKTPFVLPTRGLYEYQLNGILCMNVPLNPWCSLFFKESGESISPSNKGEGEIATLPKDHDAIVNKLNRYAMIRQKKDKLGYVVCSQKETLQYLIKQVEELEF